MEIKPEGKTTAIISYITIFGTVIAIVMNMEKQDPFARFHIRQAFGLNMLFFILGYFIGYFNSWMISSALYLFVVILWLYGFVTMLQEKYIEVPLVGTYFQKWFTFIK
ncbi:MULTISPECIES: hypothetical protein [Galbibacter]|uniref:DUF4870 domain-containing protein n=1 Tax=Galbibacter pacificus TaxID=2996052 RepID=A0ABT6FQ48_9FLAO|nr:hypothetical protein [Galbibacter pacificus]MDG3582132.1 hypothetical protein [Galbibacter pacificus]MDG3585392.1 hypothetical protein [Galbibacter pacificus]